MGWSSASRNQTKRDRWKVGIVNKVEVSTSVALMQEQITAINFHVFWNASVSGYCAIAYTVSYQFSKSNRDLRLSKLKISQQDLEIRRLKLF